jgi:hypothetical protein
MSGRELFRWQDRYHSTNNRVQTARLEHAKVLERLKAAGLQEAIDCVVPDNIPVEEKEAIWDPAHPRFSDLIAKAENTITNIESNLGAFVRWAVEEHDSNCEINEDACVQHLEHVLITQPDLQQPKRYCEARVAALQLLYVMQQGAVRSSEELQQLPLLNARGSKVHSWISTLAKNALWQARTRWASASGMVCVLAVAQWVHVRT